MRLQLPVLLICLAQALTAYAQDDAARILDVAEQHVRLQTQGLPGKVGIRISPVNTSRLPQCAALEAYTPPGARMMGRTMVGVRCLAPHSWNILVQAQITVTGEYLATTRPISAGQMIQPDDLQVRTGDLASVPAGSVSNPAEAIGKTLRNPVGAGQALRSDQLLAPIVIRQGQTVRVISQGNGFSVSSDGKAINNASAGQVAQVRMTSGQTVSGIAREDGSVEINF